MRQVLQSYRSGELWLAQLPVPALRSGVVIVQTAASLVSAGTERMIIELAKKSLIGKAKARPDLVRKVIRKIKTEGLTQTVEKVFSKLDTPIALGYSCAGTIVELGRGVEGFSGGVAHEAILPGRRPGRESGAGDRCWLFLVFFYGVSR